MYKISTLLCFPSLHNFIVIVILMNLSFKFYTRVKSDTPLLYTVFVNVLPSPESFIFLYTIVLLSSTLSFNLMDSLEHCL